MAESQETAAIVLDTLDHGESDKIVTFLTPDRGRVTGIAKGANRSKKRFLNKLELFTSLTITYSERKHSDLLFIEDAELDESYIELRTNLKRYTAASLIREVLLLATAEQQGDNTLFALVKWTLSRLQGEKNPFSVTSVFLLRLYDGLGYRPDFSSCSHCGTHYTTRQPFRFHHASGGLSCARCTPGEAEGCTDLSPGTIRLLHSVLNDPLERVDRLQFSPPALHQSLTLLHRYGRSLFQRELQSWKQFRALMQEK